ncbi:hypothetical protein O9992_27845 [Vibrio lentus]|nr:hypothetical protein [Vibrio lentus]
MARAGDIDSENLEAINLTDETQPSNKMTMVATPLHQTLIMATST